MNLAVSIAYFYPFLYCYYSDLRGAGPARQGPGQAWPSRDLCVVVLSWRADNSLSVVCVGGYRHVCFRVCACVCVSGSCLMHVLAR